MKLHHSVTHEEPRARDGCRVRALVVVVAIVGAGMGCGDNVPASPLGLSRVFRTPEIPGCTYASPVIARPSPAGTELVVVATTDGVVAAYDIHGEPKWQIALPAEPGYRAWIGATPVLVDERHVVVAWQDTIATRDSRRAHMVAVLDAATGALDPQFPIVTLTAAKSVEGGGTVDFLPSNNFSRSRLVHARRAGDDLGAVYVSFGNLRDIQPWHGWVFEIDLDRWRTSGAAAAISATLLTTPDNECGPPGQSGSDDMLCGGGVWAPSGPTLVPRGDDYELWIATGNGLLDLDRGQLANSVIRTGRGLAIDVACGAACVGFDPVAPTQACMASCANLFIPRLAPGDPALAPPAGRCDGLSFLECYAELDLDLGADSPAVVTTRAGREVGILPAKDGAVYLFDAEHFGTLHQRVQLRDFCGTHGGTCTANWAGTMVTRPTIAKVDEAPVAIIPTFYFDQVNAAGVVAFDIIDNGVGPPQLRERWHAPPRGDAEATSRFREHTGNAAVLEVAGFGPQIVIADPDGRGGRLYLIDAATGAIRDRGAIDGAGRKYIEPAIVGDRAFVTSCTGGPDGGMLPGSSHLEGWDVVAH